MDKHGFVKTFLLCIPVILGGCAFNEPFVHSSVRSLSINRIAIIKADASQPKYRSASITRVWDRSTRGRDLVEGGKLIGDGYRAAVVPPGSYEVIVKCYNLGWVVSYARKNIVAKEGVTYLLTCVDGYQPFTTELSLNISEQPKLNNP